MHAKLVDGPSDVDYVHFFFRMQIRAHQKIKQSMALESPQTFYQASTGYYISNSATIDSTIAVDSYIKRPDIKTQHYGANFLYNFNAERFSPSAAFKLSGRQTKNGGAWLASGLGWSSSEV